MFLSFLNDDSMLHHAMMFLGVSYEELMDDTYIFLEPQSCYDVANQIYDDRILF